MYHAIVFLPLLGFLVAISFSGFPGALRFEALGGTCDQTRDDKGIWWNDHYETNVDLSTRCYQLGVSKTPWAWKGLDLGWRAAYVNLGKIKTNSVMAARDEDQFVAQPDGSNCDWATSHGCAMRTIGGGTAQGLSFGGVIEKPIHRFVLGAEAGGFFYYNHFTVDILSYPDGAFVTHWDHAKGWLLTPYWGLNLRHKWLMLAVRHYQKVTAHKSGCGGCSGIANGEAWQVTAGVSIPL